MVKNIVFRRLTFLVSLVVLLVSTVNITVGLIVTKTDSIVNTFIPSLLSPSDMTVGITVNKTVKNIGTATIDPAGFEFVLENTVDGEKITCRSNESGRAVCWLSFTSEDIGKVYTYRLYETDQGVAGVTYDDRVYDLSVSVSQSENQTWMATVVIDGQSVDEAVVEFVNIYDADISVTPPTGNHKQRGLWFAIALVSASVCIFLAVADKRYRVSRTR